MGGELEHRYFYLPDTAAITKLRYLDRVDEGMEEMFQVSME
jgi:hypothetical protein